MVVVYLIRCNPRWLKAPLKGTSSHAMDLAVYAKNLLLLLQCETAFITIDQWCRKSLAETVDDLQHLT